MLVDGVLIKKANIRVEKKTIHVVVKYLPCSLLQKGVGRAE
jgi:hypothetical protein